MGGERASDVLFGRSQPAELNFLARCGGTNERAKAEAVVAGDWKSVDEDSRPPNEQVVVARQEIELGGFGCLLGQTEITASEGNGEQEERSRASKTCRGEGNHVTHAGSLQIINAFPALLIPSSEGGIRNHLTASFVKVHPPMSPDHKQVRKVSLSNPSPSLR